MKWVLIVIFYCKGDIDSHLLDLQAYDNQQLCEKARIDKIPELIESGCRYKTYCTNNEEIIAEYE